MKNLIFAIFDFLAWPFTILLMCSAMTPTAFFILFLLRHFHIVVIISLTPFFYFMWLFTFLIISSAEMSFFGIFFKKPKKLIFLEDLKSTLTAVVFHNASKRLRMVWSIPFIQKLLIPTYTMPFITWLVFKSYTLGKIKIGSMSAVYSFLVDPDLVEIGKNVVIGARAFLVSHAVKTTTDGKALYITESIIINDNVTIGSDAFISMGVNIGKNALVLAKSYVKPNTVIKENEVWGGNPAKFIRLRSKKNKTDK